jgi:hypothetical protein
LIFDWDGRKLTAGDWEDMSISLKFEPREGFLYCEASGEYSFEDACSMIRAVLVESAQHSSTKVLVDFLQMKGSPTMLERYSISEFLAREMVDHITELKRFPRLALLGKEPLVDPNRFGELVARNRGVQMKTVEQMEDAVKWLDREVES